MSVVKHIQPDLSDAKYFDQMFDEMNQGIAHMHHDMRSAMHRITPVATVSEAGGELQNQLDKIREPVVVNPDGTKELNLQFDVSGFKPEEVRLHTENGQLQVEAQHEEKSDDSRVYRQFSRNFTLPEGTDVDKMSSTLTKDGVLVVRGPVNAK